MSRKGKGRTDVVVVFFSCARISRIDRDCLSIVQYSEMLRYKNVKSKERRKEGMVDHYPFNLALARSLADWLPILCIASQRTREPRRTK
jgi:hypothetical protein